MPVADVATAKTTEQAKCAHVIAALVMSVA